MNRENSHLGKCPINMIVVESLNLVPNCGVGRSSSTETNCCVQHLLAVIVSGGIAQVGR